MPGLRFSPWSGTKILKAVQQGVWALDKGPGLCSQGLCRGVLGRACTLVKAGAGSEGLSGGLGEAGPSELGGAQGQGSLESRVSQFGLASF